MRVFHFPSLVSSPPTGIKTVNVTVTTITLSWQPPEHPGGAVRGYRVTVNGTVHDTLPWQHTLMITNLTPGSKYALVIQALNGAGGGETSQFFVATLDPGEPVALTCSVHRVYIRVSSNRMYAGPIQVIARCRLFVFHVLPSSSYHQIFFFCAMMFACSALRPCGSEGGGCRSSSYDTGVDTPIQLHPHSQTLQLALHVRVIGGSGHGPHQLNHHHGNPPQFRRGYTVCNRTVSSEQSGTGTPSHSAREDSF